MELTQSSVATYAMVIELSFLPSKLFSNTETQNFVLFCSLLLLVNKKKILPFILLQPFFYFSTKESSQCFSTHKWYESSAMCFVEICSFIIGRTTNHISVDGTGTIHKFNPVAGTDKINRNGIQISIDTKLYNLCAMVVYKRVSIEVQKNVFCFRHIFRSFFY